MIPTKHSLPSLYDMLECGVPVKVVVNEDIFIYYNTIYYILHKLVEFNDGLELYVSKHLIGPLTDL